MSPCGVQSVVTMLYFQLGRKQEVEELIERSIQISRKILPEITPGKNLVLAFGKLAGQTGGTNIITLRKS